MIRETLYREILRTLPVACVDLVVRRADGKFLVVRRKNEPLKGEWWVVGGRILQGEKVGDAVLRKLKQEVGLVSLGAPRFIGLYEDFFDRNSFEMAPYHTLSLVYEVTVDGAGVILDDQSDGIRWDEALPERFIVQPSYSRDYVRKSDDV